MKSEEVFDFAKRFYRHAIASGFKQEEFEKIICRDLSSPYTDKNGVLWTLKNGRWFANKTGSGLNDT